MAIRVLAFATSPRRHGNSETLLDWLLSSMQEGEDVEVVKHVLNDDIVIHPCRGCNACEVLGRCVQTDDDLNRVLDEVIEADIVVLASPIFCLGLCAQAKALVDRSQVFRSRKYVLKQPVVPPGRKDKRLGIFVSTAGQKWDIVFDGAKMSMKCFFHVSDIRDANMWWLLADGVDKKGEIRGHPTAGDEAERMGKKAVQWIRERKGA
ncbi:MAG: flavodoxin family protein [Methanomicrobiaceae archaeon]|nr:flavodoxin family protein [Methanomicrobiaceae archaeon]